MCTVRILTDQQAHEFRPAPPYEVWALRTGEQILFVERGLHRLVGRFHMAGNYQAGAQYAISYEELVAVLESKLGPHDRARCEDLQAKISGIKSGLKRANLLRAQGALLMAFALTLKVLWLGFKFVLFVCLFPFVIMFIGRRH